MTVVTPEPTERGRCLMAARLKGLLPLALVIGVLA